MKAGGPMEISLATPSIDAPRMLRRRGKLLVRSCLQMLFRNDMAWEVFRRFPVRGVLAARKKIISDRLAARHKHDPSVLAGPFQGLAYPQLDSAGSTLLPKLLGTYESELHPVIRSLTGLKFSVIVDIGCAEGYYAVGLSRLFPTAKVFAYDISPKARDLCAAMAQVNGAGNIAVRGFCDRNELLALPTADPHLVLSDCEGYEKELFDRAVIEHLRSSYFIIELHDFKDRAISRMIPPLFSATHKVEIISSVPDREKAARYRSAFLYNCDSFEREVAFAENRPEIMQWLVARPRPA